MDEGLKLKICERFCSGLGTIGHLCTEWETCDVHTDLEQVFRDAGWVRLPSETAFPSYDRFKTAFGNEPAIYHEILKSVYLWLEQASLKGTNGP